MVPPALTFYYVMELLEGPTLEDLVHSDGPLPAGRVVHFMKQIAGSLAEAHAAGLIHRDIKPGNIMVTARGGVPDFVKVFDFGLVRYMDGPSSAKITSTSAVTGTPMYMSPEQVVDPDHVGPASDIYQVGAVAYFLLTGVEPFSGNSIVQILHQHMEANPVSPSDKLGAPVPPDLEALVLKCLAKKASDRPASASALVEALDALDVPPWSHAEAAASWQRSQAIASGVRSEPAAPFAATEVVRPGTPSDR